ncbi:pyruvate dehydrogenase complex dihydrolipoamide acetyltransferase [Rickettsia endosymbiont of Oedothorax gibbosus]|uniref:pyruvate dehydrogenase complex dihydrolipoamide acetyltransferase n=1 Tax=Rickettsia endosymbiont of Oedothorax gibbosus TaxID=931099 RepID=UPI002024A024|nr:pyruvate dehydrogenase complex dihydrolipoamide acetyltransferase [Rickettsia endosymbiont of Oedothorax gibbosus]
MPIKILMPALSPTMTEGNVSKWLKKEGDKVVPGDVIAEIETDKANMEVESVDEGVLAKIIVPQGTENVAVNSLIAVLLEEGEDISLLDNFISNIDNAAKSSEKPAIVVEESKSVNLTPENKTIKDTARVYASPLARRLAAIDNIDLSNIQGSGPHGRIIKKDVLSYLVQPTNSGKIRAVNRNNQEYRAVPNNNIRKIIAKRLLESKQTIPHFYLSIECNMDKLLDIREDINKSLIEESNIKISVNDFVILAVAKALKIVPEANASWDESAIRYYNNVDVSVAVAIDNGLITPIVRNADQKDLVTLSRELQTLIKKARDNKLTPEEFQGGGFSVSNLGMYGVKSFNAIINPPQSCILAIGASSKRPIVDNDQIKVATMMDVSLSSDHRVVDGAVGAKFLASFKKFIESPALMLI